MKKKFSECLNKQLDKSVTVSNLSTNPNISNLNNSLNQNHLNKADINSFTSFILNNDSSDKNNSEHIIKIFKSEIKDSKVRALLLLNLCTIQVDHKIEFINKIFPLLLYVYNEQSFFFKLAILKEIDTYLETYTLSKKNILNFKKYFANKLIIQQIKNSPQLESNKIVSIINSIFNKLKTITEI